MKRLLLLTFALLSMGMVHAQIANLKQQAPNESYAMFTSHSKTQSYVLSNVYLDKEYTAIQVKFTVNSHQYGSFTIDQNSAYISGEWGVLYPYKYFIGNDQWRLGTPFRYDSNNKGKSVMITLLYERIPAGFSTINFCNNGTIIWPDIPINNPDPVENSNWTQKALKEYWKTRTLDPIEGIYTFVDTDNTEWWGSNKHTLAIVENEYEEFDVIYLGGSDEKIWKIGDIKANIIPTAIDDLYKVNWWYMENKMVNENFYLRYDNSSFSVYETDENITANFLKLYPSFKQTQNSSNKRAGGSTEMAHSGSGVMISKNGVIATNYHVVKDATTIEVLVNNKSKIETYPAKVLCLDKANDLALLVIDSAEEVSFEEPPFLISSKAIDVGASIFTMGYPIVDYLGEEVKITDGIISSKTGYEGDIATYQISAPIQPGNSGGPLFDKNGSLVGITNATVAGAQNVGYAIKSSYLLNLVESAPIEIEYPTNNQLTGVDFPEQVKLLTKYVVYIKSK